MKKKETNRRITLEAFTETTDGRSYAGVFWCVVTLTPELAQDLLRRMNLVRDLKTQEPSVAWIQFHSDSDGLVEWFGDNADGDGPEGEPEGAMENEYLSVTENNVHWETKANNWDIEFWCAPLARRDIEEVALAEAAP